ncbi:peroxiredoxin [Alphaproteobacteria bacterium]|nr:peroxiredoxin [Alphaproteobacteria bacterium]
MSTLLENMTAPVFKINRDGGSVIDSSKLKNPYIVYFYPKDDTPGCTKEAIEFSDNSDFFIKNSIIIIGISKDTVEKHDKFIIKHNLKVILGSDISGEICDNFGVWIEKSMYGKKYMGIERSTFLISKNNIIHKVWRKVRVKGHVDEVISASKSLLNI